MAHSLPCATRGIIYTSLRMVKHGPYFPVARRKGALIFTYQLPDILDVTASDLKCHSIDGYYVLLPCALFPVL